MDSRHSSTARSLSELPVCENARCQDTLIVSRVLQSTACCDCGKVLLSTRAHVFTLSCSLSTSSFGMG
eukprot:3836681-Amphidinium_carterae.1